MSSMLWQMHAGRGKVIVLFLECRCMRHAFVVKYGDLTICQHPAPQLFIFKKDLDIICFVFILLRVAWCLCVGARKG